MVSRDCVGAIFSIRAQPRLISASLSQPDMGSFVQASSASETPSDLPVSAVRTLSRAQNPVLYADWSSAFRVLESRSLVSKNFFCSAAIAGMRGWPVHELAQRAITPI
jgi:hypothetical protein